MVKKGGHIHKIHGINCYYLVSENVCTLHKFHSFFFCDVDGHRAVPFG